MKRWQDCVISTRASVGEALATIDRGGMQVAVVIDDHGGLAGLVTDGDCRRAILKGVGLDEPVAQAMNRHPLTIPVGASREEIRAFMVRHAIHQVPLVSPDGRVAGVVLIDDLLRPSPHDNAVVLMAGGLGSRLGPLTAARPKPMLEVSGKPILQIILENFVAQGFGNFYFSVNYLAESIQQHFGDGSQWGARITYLREGKRLGTAGSLSLLPADAPEPMIVMNGDLLTRIDFGELLDHHAATGAGATMVVREHETQIPFGVVRLEHGEIVEIAEKPVQRHFVNAGMYVLSRRVLDLVPPDQYLDMPSLFARAIGEGIRTSAFPLQDYWLDIGRVEEYERAKSEWGEP